MYALNIYISKTLIKMVYPEFVSSEKKKVMSFFFFKKIKGDIKNSEQVCTMSLIVNHLKHVVKLSIKLIYT